MAVQYTFQIIGSSYSGDGVAFCPDKPITKEQLKLPRSCARPLLHHIDAESVLIGKWLKKIAEGDEQMMTNMSHNISRCLYDYNNSPKSKEHQIFVYKMESLSNVVYIAEIDAKKMWERDQPGGYWDIVSGSILSEASYFGGKIYFNSKSSWLYKAIITT